MVSMDIFSLNRALSKGRPLVISAETTPGLFLLAMESIKKNEKMTFKVPKAWEEKPPKIYILISKNTQIKNGTQVTQLRTAELAQTAISRIKDAFVKLGCEVVEDRPTRFERAPVI